MAQQQRSAEPIYEDTRQNIPITPTPSPRSRTPLWTLILGLIFGLFAGQIAPDYLNDSTNTEEATPVIDPNVEQLQQFLDSFQWKPTTAEITNAFSVQGEGENALYRIGVEYKYTVDGKTYTSERIYFGHSLNSFVYPNEDALDLVQLYTEDPTQRVYYDPDNPQSAVLERCLGQEIMGGEKICRN